jgi:hypothetical protein
MPKLKNLPSTAVAFQENVKRAHYQARVWKEASRKHPPDVDLTRCGWTKDESSRSLIVTPLLPGTDVAPKNLLQMISCNCALQGVNVQLLIFHAQDYVNALKVKNV